MIITKLNRSEKELQEFYLYCLFVANKTSEFADNVLAKVLSGNRKLLPFNYLKNLGQSRLMRLLKNSKTGQYTRLHRAIRESIDLKLQDVSLSDLLNIHGIGNKTARFFLLHTRKRARLAVLDVYVLRWMRELHNIKTPKQTPSGKKYLELEQIAIKLIGKNFARADFKIWKEMKYGISVRSRDTRSNNNGGLQGS